MPPVVKNLLIVNGLFFLATVVLKDKFFIDLKILLGLYLPNSDMFKPYQIISHVFIHADLMHILSNMFMLWMFGSTMENLWGSKRFFIYYFVTAIGSAILYTAVKYVGFIADSEGMSDEVLHLIKIRNIDALNRMINELNVTKVENVLSALHDPAIGASGAVFGVLLAYGMYYPNTMVYLYFAIPLKAKYFVALYGLFELTAGFANNPSDNVAHFAHLGGMLFGYLLIMIWKKRGRMYY